MDGIGFAAAKSGAALIRLHRANRIIKAELGSEILNKGLAPGQKDEPTSKGGCSQPASWLSYQRTRISISQAILSSLKPNTSVHRKV